jgi:hypothetical protein
MSRLLLNEQPLLIMPQLACKLGLNESVILQQIHYWLGINEKANNNFKDGKYWTFNSYEEWQKQFPFWSISTIQRTISKLEKMGLLIIGNYNKLKIDRTKWYTINYEMLDNIENEPIYQNDMTNTSTRCDESINMIRPLPETNTKTNPETNLNVYGAFSAEQCTHTFSYSNYAEGCKNYEYFRKQYFMFTGMRHPDIYGDELKRVITELDEFESEYEYEMIDKYFNTELNCDYKIWHYLSEGIRINRIYEVGL